MVARDERFYVKVTEAEKQMAREVAEALGDEGVSQTMRRLLRDKHRELFGEQPKRRPGSRKR